LTDVQQVVKGRTAARVTGKLLLYIKGGELQARPGQIIRWRSTLRQPSRFGNPGEFNYPLYLAARGIYVTSFLNRAEDLTVLFIPQQRTLIWRTGVTALQCITKRSCRTTLQGTCNRSCLAGGEESASNSANSSLVNNFYLADNMTTIAATLATAPSSLWHFHQFSPAGLLTNLFPIPLIA